MRVHKAKKVRFSPNGVAKGQFKIPRKTNRLQMVSSGDDSDTEEIYSDIDKDNHEIDSSDGDVVCLESSGDEQDSDELLKIEKQLKVEKKKYQLLSLRKQNRDLRNDMVNEKKTDDVTCNDGYVYGQSDYLFRKPGQAQPNLNNLRSIDSLVQNVEEEMTNFGLFEMDVPSRHQCDRKNVNGEFAGKNENSGKEKPLRSGADEIASSAIQAKLRWPQAMLKYSHANKKYTFNTLPSFNLLVAGEMSCLLEGGLSKEETIGRMKLLRDSAYHCERFAWEGVRDFHYNVMLGVERGERSWDDSTMEIQTNTLLTSNHQKSNVASNYGGKSQQYAQSYSKKSDSDRKWFCAEFQRGTCAFQGRSHEAVIRGTKRWVEHFCATCMQKSKQIKYHSETSRDCPHAAQNPTMSSNNVHSLDTVLHHVHYY